MTQPNQRDAHLAPEGTGGGYAAVLTAISQPVHGEDAVRRAVESAGHHLLILRFALFNTTCFALLGAAWMRGWTDVVLAADDTGLSLGIFIVFLAGLGLCAVRVLEVSTELEQARAPRPRVGSRAAAYLAAVANRDSGSRATEGARMKLALATHVAPIQHIANSLVLLGLIGTVVGFIIALSGVNPSTAGNVDAITPMVAELIHGMSVALYTTLVGSVLHLWLKVNGLILSGGAVRLVDRLVGRGERDARL